MLQAIVSWSLHNRAAVLVLAVLLLLGGLYAAGHAHLDAFPEFAPPQVIVQTEAPGLSAREVEQLVTLPIEQALSGAAGLEALRSRSIQGLSAITVVFQDNVDVYRARQLVAERLTEVGGRLPAGVKTPRLGPMTKTTGRLVVFGFTSDKLSPLALRDRIQWTVRPRLLAVRGVAEVTLFGGEMRQFQVQVNPAALAAHRLTLTDILDATRQATKVSGAGFQENDNQRLVVRAEGQIYSAAQLEETVVAASSGTPVRLRDVARVVEGAEPKFGDALIDGKAGMALLAYKQFGADTLEVTRALEAELDKLLPDLEREGIVIRQDLFRQADFIQHSIGNVVHSLFLGALFVIIVLFVLLFNLRAAFISLTAIPLSLLAAVFVLWAFGVSLNTLTLGGLAIAVGEVVDDAVIDVENIFRRLRENARLGSRRSSLAVVLAASLEVRSAVVYATFIVVLVFVPVFFLSGVQGRLFAPLGYAYALSVLASLAVALTVTPALSLLLLPRAGGAEEPPLLRRCQGAYEFLLRRLDGRFPLLAAVMLLLLLASAWAIFDFGGEFLPELRENHFIVHVQGVPGTSLPQSLAAGAIVNRDLHEEPAVRAVCQLAGRTELGEDTWGVEYSELEVPISATEAEDIEQLQGSIRKRVCNRFPGSHVFTFLSECIHDSLSGSNAPVAVKVYGHDLTALEQASGSIAAVLAATPGSQNVWPDPQTGQPELVIRVRPRDAARYNLRAAAILDAVHTAYQGAEVAQTYDGNRVIDLVVVLDPALRNDPAAVKSLWLSVPPLTQTSPPAGGEVWVRGDGRVQLKQVADVFHSDGRFLITHEGGLRMQMVTCALRRDRDPESFAADVERRLGALNLPPGVTYVVTGEHQAKQATQRELLLLGLAAGVAAVLLLWLAFGSARLLVLVLLNLPFALVGGVAATYALGGVVNVGSLVGFVTLFGITMRNGIMMVSHWQHLHEVEGVPWGPELVIRGARERLAPVLMTALVTGLGLLPIAVGSGEAGREIEGPMAIVILGGLISSTALSLFVLPVIYRRFGSVIQ
jgi:CzcA family heavy metal efflux pump